MNQRPMLGEDVHYHDDQGRRFAAKVVKIWSDTTVNLYVFDDGSKVLGEAAHPVASVPWNRVYGHPFSWSFPHEEPEDDEGDLVIEKTPAKLLDEEPIISKAALEKIVNAVPTDESGEQADG